MELKKMGSTKKSHIDTNTSSLTHPYTPHLSTHTTLTYTLSFAHVLHIRTLHTSPLTPTPPTPRPTPHAQVTEPLGAAEEVDVPNRVLLAAAEVEREKHKVRRKHVEIRVPYTPQTVVLITMDFI